MSDVATTEVNRQLVLARRPHGVVEDADFEMRTSPVPSPGPGELLVRVLYLSFDPAQRGWMNDARSYVPPVAIGEPMRAGAVAQVVASNHDGFAVGALVMGGFGWQDYVVSDGRTSTGAITALPAGVTPQAALGVLGLTGMTAYFGLVDVGRIAEGNVVVVNGAAGATGSVAGQVARILGARRVVGIAGGEEKCRWLTEAAGFDAAIDYRAEKVGARLRELVPEGIDLYWDNVGGDMLEAGLANLALRGRVVLCGGISQYSATEPVPGPRNYLQLITIRGRMEGFLVFDYAKRYGEAGAALAGWVAEGRITTREDVQEGLENAPATLRRLFEGRNLGKQLLRVADAPLSPPPSQRG